MRNSDPVRGVKLSPTHATLQKTGESIELNVVEKKLALTIQTVRDMVEWGRSVPQKDEYYKALSDGAHPDTGEVLPSSLNEVGRVVGYRYQEFLPEEMLVKSRVERLINHNHVSDDKAMGKKLKQVHGETAYVSKTYKHTLSLSQPTASPSINLGAVNNLYAKIEANNNTIRLHLVAYDTKVILHFTLPEHYNDHTKINLPTITLNKNNTLTYNFSTQRQRLHPTISDTHVIGVDFGVRVPYVASVVGVGGGVVETVLPSRLVMSLSRDVRVSVERVRSMWVNVDKAIARGDVGKYLRLLTEIKQARLGCLVNVGNWLFGLGKKSLTSVYVTITL